MEPSRYCICLSIAWRPRRDPNGLAEAVHDGIAESQELERSCEEYEVDEPYTEWHDKEGTHSQAYSDIFLGTSKFYPALISEIAGYARESINAGRKNKFTAVSKDAIHPETSTTDETQVESAFQARITATQREACRKQVDKLGEVSTTVDITKNTLVYYPIWMCPYSYDGKDYLCIVPGTKNSPLGTKPLSLTKVGVAIAAVAILLGVLWFYTSHMARPL